jgi:ABC-2 type transport system permease protein
VSGLFLTFLRKEGSETLKTWRLWVLPGILVFLGLTTPLLTKLTPAILKATASSQPGVVFKIPPPVARDSYLQYMGNLSQMVMIAIIITGAAIIAAERKAGTAVLVLTKPISRAGFVVSKAVSQLVLLIVAAVLGAALCVAATIALFGTGSIARFAEAAALWLVLACAMLMLMLMLSAAMSGQAPAAGVGVAVWVVLVVLTGFPLIRDHSPAGLIAANDAALRGRSAALFWPVVTTLIAAAACLAGAVWAFRRKEL